MTEKEIREIKKSLGKDRNTISKIYGCYVNTTGEIIAEFEESTALMTEDESEKYFAIFRRTLSGSPDKNLVSIPFSNEQVLSGEEHKLLSALRKTELKDEESRKNLFSKIAGSYSSKENYVILLAFNSYDVPFSGKNGDGDSSEVFSFLVCSICPVKTTRPVLSYDPDKKSFVNDCGNNVISSADAGFVFPSFDDRKTNIYASLFYSKDSGNEHSNLTNALFGNEIKMSAKAQNTLFKTVLSDSLKEDCSFKVIKNVNNLIEQKIEKHKESKDDEPLTLSKYQLRDFLSFSGIDEEKLDSFTDSFTTTFGNGTELPPKNIIDTKKFVVKTPDVIIKVANGKNDLIDTRIIDGIKYIVIRADDGVELNGLNVKFDKEEQQN